MLTIKDICWIDCISDHIISASHLVVCGMIPRSCIFKRIVVPTRCQSSDGIFVRLVCQFLLCPFLLLIDAEISPVRRLHLSQFILTKFINKMLPCSLRRVPPMHIAPLGNRQLEWVNEEVLVLEVLLLRAFSSNPIEVVVLLAGAAICQGHLNMVVLGLGNHRFSILELYPILVSNLFVVAGVTAHFKLVRILS